MGEHHAWCKVSVCCVFRTKAAVRSHDATWLSTTRTTSRSFAFDFELICGRYRFRNFLPSPNFCKPHIQFHRPIRSHGPQIKTLHFVTQCSESRDFTLAPEGITHKHALPTFLLIPAALADFHTASIQTISSGTSEVSSLPE